MGKVLKRILSVAIAIAFVATLMPQTKVSAATTITDNYTKDTAYNLGSWSAITSSPTVVLNEGETESWFKFTVAAGEHIYIRTSTDTKYEGMRVQLKNSNGANIGTNKTNPEDIIDSTGLTPALYVDVDNDTTSSKTYYLLASRGESYEATMYFGLSAGNRIRTGSGTFSFLGTATNAGNAGLSLSGVNSTTLSLNLTKNTGIPEGAIVTRVTTSGTQSPSQGNVHHMLKPASAGMWYTSVVASATSGSYSISLTDDYAAKQVWYYQYNALATAKSTMKSISLRISWQYDLNQTQYKIFTN